MNIELIDRVTAIQRERETKILAFAIAEANGTLPGYCSAPECQIWMDYAALLSGGLTKPTERCVFIDGYAARQVGVNPDGLVPGANEIISRIAGNHLQKAEVKDGRLLLYYPDVIEIFRYDESIACWRFVSSDSAN